ncbi:KH domain-containing protein [Candidatus Poribacteria bacterium]|nr:KH domain-containing protein [Candidatus Poribacteria bacterium]
MALKTLIEYIAKSLVDHPDQVDVNEIEGEKTTILELKVAEDDLGKIIGRHGRTAKAMRTVINAAATKESKRAVLEILEGDDRNNSN